MAERDDWRELAQQFRKLAERAPDMFAADIKPKKVWTLIGGTDADRARFDDLSRKGAAGLDPDTISALQGTRGRQIWLSSLAKDPLMSSIVETASAYASGEPIAGGPIRQIERVCEVCAEYCDSVAMTPRRLTKLEALRREANMKLLELVALMFPGGKLANLSNVQDHLHGRRSMQPGTADAYARVFSKELKRTITRADVVGYES